MEIVYYDFNMTVQDDGNATIIPVKVTVVNGDEDPYFDYGDGNQTVTFSGEQPGTVFDVMYLIMKIAPSSTDLTVMDQTTQTFRLTRILVLVTFKSPPDYEEAVGWRRFK